VVAKVTRQGYILLPKNKAKEGKMNLHHIELERCLKILQVLDGWATIEDICLMAVGVPHSSRVEGMVGRLVKSDHAISRRWGKRKLYIIPRRAKGRMATDELNLVHSLGCTTIRARLSLADRTAQIISERQLHKSHEFPLVSDGGVVFPPDRSGRAWVLLYEFGTADNSARLNVLRWKVNRYLQVVEQRPTYQVLFVLDLTADKLVDTVSRLPSHGALWYVDYHTFTGVPIGQHLTAPIYINGGDGQTYPLKAQ
jgi:hypothetical protein